MICFILAWTVLVCWSDLNSNFCFVSISWQIMAINLCGGKKSLSCCVPWKQNYQWKLLRLWCFYQLLPSVKSSVKYHFLEEIDQQCCDLCVRKHALYVLHVCRKETKSSLESFTWSSVLQEMKDRALDVLDFIATISVPVVKEKENQVPPLFWIPWHEKHLPKKPQDISVSQ